MCMQERRGVAQPGSALGLGPRGRRFESSRPDQSQLAFERLGFRSEPGFGFLRVGSPSSRNTEFLFQPSFFPQFPKKSDF